MDCCWDCDYIICCDPCDEIEVTYLQKVPVIEEIICVDAKPRRCRPKREKCCVEYITYEIDPCDICW
ncbi:hypothetical protein I4U23_016538 [Adineta vaga]|nr:hypothetical protein I4U23_016538 [Adineta vaga]